MKFAVYAKKKFDNFKKKDYVEVFDTHTINLGFKEISSYEFKGDIEALDDDDLAFVEKQIENATINTVLVLETYFLVADPKTFEFYWVKSDNFVQSFRKP